jgi:hypothetical protein
MIRPSICTGPLDHKLDFTFLKYYSFEIFKLIAVRIMCDRFGSSVHQLGLDSLHRLHGAGFLNFERATISLNLTILCSHLYHKPYRA